jgi:hypothetical protein
MHFEIKVIGLCVFYVMFWYVVMCGTNKTARIGAVCLMEKCMKIGNVSFSRWNLTSFDDPYQLSIYTAVIQRLLIHVSNLLIIYLRLFWRKKTWQFKDLTIWVPLYFVLSSVYCYCFEYHEIFNARTLYYHIVGRFDDKNRRRQIIWSLSLSIRKLTCCRTLQSDLPLDLRCR